MRLILFNNNRLQRMQLPKKREGSFWLVDELNKNENIINVECIDNKWIYR